MLLEGDFQLYKVNKILCHPCQDLPLIPLFQKTIHTQKNARAPKPKPFSTAQWNPPTQYEASMFKGTNMDDLEFENLNNVSMADLSGLNLLKTQLSTSRVL
ncbi:hypothetical protein BDQ17DRAFT_1438750 [Cyathus striatus]|nr:hypothetical protein BDQ17DRAFT_1438750 [Cyathus striatus]